MVIENCDINNKDFVSLKQSAHDIKINNCYRFANPSNQKSLFMKRRIFIKNTSALAASIGVFGKIQWNGESFIGDTPTTTDVLGPFYRPGAPMRENITPKDFSGTLMHVSGKIYKED